MNTKERRHSGRVEGKPTIPIKEYIRGGNENIFWDDWTDYRDSMRVCADRTKIRSPQMWFSKNYEVQKYNKKIKKKEMIRRKKLQKLKLKAM